MFVALDVLLRCGPDPLVCVSDLGFVRERKRREDGIDGIARDCHGDRTRHAVLEGDSQGDVGSGEITQDGRCEYWPNSC